MQIPFVTVDVFTDRKFGGNPLAVFPDATSLTSAQMQAIAGEFNLAETTFVLPPREPSHTAEVRIFTPRAELPFAGHPNIGTAFVLAQESERAGRSVGAPMIFEEKAGLVRLNLIKDGASVIGARLTPPQALNRGDDLDPEIIAAACSLRVSDVETANHRPCIVSCGAGERTAAHRSVHPTPAGRADDRHPALCSRSSRRMFGPLVGVPEDAASGSPNVALGGLLASLRPEPDLKFALRIGQGVDMGRPSLLEAGAEKQNGKITSLSIGGGCVPMMRGVLEV